MQVNEVTTLTSQNYEPETVAVQKMVGLTPSIGYNLVW